MKINKNLERRVRKLSKLGIDKNQRRDVISKTSGACNYFRGLALDCYLERPNNLGGKEEYKIIEYILSDRSSYASDELFWRDSQSF